MNRTNGFAWRPTTTVLLLGGFLLVLIAIVAAYMVTAFRPTTEVRTGSNVYHVWVAQTDAERTKGLSGVRKLSPNGGLLMDFKRDGSWGIWMKDMLIPLDIIWIDSNKQVIYIVKNVPPEQSTDSVMRPKNAARYVLELPAGSVDKSAIKTGQKLEFNLEEVQP